jgi:hypothetical protein
MLTNYRDINAAVEEYFAKGYGADAAGSSSGAVN